MAVEALSDCDWVALLNPDAFPEPEWLLEHVRAFEAYPDGVCFGSQLLCAADPSLSDGRGDAYHVSGRAWRRDHLKPLRILQNENPEEVFAACAAAALYRRDVYLRLGGLDEDYFCYYEDVDLGFRLRLAVFPSGKFRKRGLRTSVLGSPAGIAIFPYIMGIEIWSGPLSKTCLGFFW